MEQVTDLLLLMGGLSTLYGLLGVLAGALEWGLERFQHARERRGQALFFNAPDAG